MQAELCVLDDDESIAFLHMLIVSKTDFLDKTRHTGIDRCDVTVYLCIIGIVVLGVIGKYIEEHDAMKKNIEQFQAAAVERTKNDLIAKAREVNGVKVITAVLPLEPAAAKDLMFKLRQAVPSNLLAVVGSVAHEKPMLNVCMSDDLVKDHSLNAGQMVREAAKLIQGGGGGQPHFAQAGGKNVDGLSAAVDKVVELAQL